MNTYVHTLATPFGPFSVAVNETGAVLATAFGDLRSLQSRFDATDWTENTSKTRAVREQVQAYCAGTLRRFSLPLAPAGTPFQHRVWTELSRIPLGETRSYGALAAALGQPKAARAIGRVNATNPVCLLVPCHRVIGADGALTGFAFGEHLKRRLLEHERALVAGRAA